MGKFLGDTRGLCKRICIELTRGFVLNNGAILAIAGRSYIEIVLDIDAILIQSCIRILYQNYCISFWFYGNRLGSLGSRGCWTFT